MSESLDPLRRTFDPAADLYEAARPSYPNELFDDLVELARLELGNRLLEIGCATGKATRPLLERVADWTPRPEHRPRCRRPLATHGRSAARPPTRPLPPEC